jgi:hypothetical protein
VFTIFAAKGLIFNWKSSPIISPISSIDGGSVILMGQKQGDEELYRS